MMALQDVLTPLQQAIGSAASNDVIALKDKVSRRNCCPRLLFCVFSTSYFLSPFWELHVCSMQLLECRSTLAVKRSLSCFFEVQHPFDAAMSLRVMLMISRRLLVLADIVAQARDR